MLLISGGSAWSNADVTTGLHRGLTAIGVESHPFQIDIHIEDAIEWLAHQRVRHNLVAPDSPTTDLIDAGCLAGQQAVIRALAVGAQGVVVVTGTYLDDRIPELFRRALIPTFLYATESPYDDDVLHGKAPVYAAVSTNDRGSLGGLEAAVAARGAATWTMHLPLGYDPGIHHPGAAETVLDVDVPRHDVVFVGNVFPSRDRFLRVVDWVGEGINLGLYGDFRTMPIDSPLWAYTPEAATPDDSLRIVPNRVTTVMHARAKIALNFFREERFRGIDAPETWLNPTTVDGAESVNPRLIECCAAGTFVLSQWRPAMDEPPWDVVPTFRTPDQMRDMIRHYLAHPEERAEISARLPAAVAGWSYHDRATVIVDVLSELRRALRG